MQLPIDKRLGKLASRRAERVGCATLIFVGIRILPHFPYQPGKGRYYLADTSGVRIMNLIQSVTANFTQNTLNSGIIGIIAGTTGAGLAAFFATRRQSSKRQNHRSN